MNEKIRIGISSCLLGEMVRYDGGHQLDRYLRDTLGSYFEYMPVCPEVEVGLPTPRDTLRLASARPTARPARSCNPASAPRFHWMRCTPAGESDTTTTFITTRSITSPARISSTTPRRPTCAPRSCRR